jgi:putative transposase
MGYQKPTFATGEIYHVYNRGVEKREIFLEPSDYFRMVHDLYELNDANAVINSQYGSRREIWSCESFQNREPLVEILAFVLMPNHYHLALRQIEDDGITRFMHKLGVGYAMYFNTINDRVGPLFQGRFKATHIKTEDYLRNLIGYIHTNPVDLMSNYRDRISITMDHLRKYRWSSFPDYVGSVNFPSVTSREFISNVMDGAAGISASAESWITHRGEKKATIPEVKQVRSR